ncbi:MAG: sugar ABC transporter permease [Spirochaetia bacterium]|nr:sugar ABC transporter permease [Spirochaetia bacterium]
MKSKSRINLPVIYFVLPFMVVYVIFQIYPLFQAVIASMFEWDLLTSSKSFIGFKNYIHMFQDPTFWSSLTNTIKFVIFSTPLLIGVGLLFALLLNGTSSKKVLFRTAYFAPYVFSVSIVTLIWGFMFNPQKGLLGEFSRMLGVEPINWLTDPTFAMPAIIIATLWWTVGFNMVLLLAGLQDIDPALYESSSLEGATWFQDFLYITLPSLRRTLELVTILQIIMSFQIFGQVYILTKGGPGGTTRVLIQYIYETGFRDYQLGYASAMAFILFLVMAVVSFFQFRLSKEEN